MAVGVAVVGLGFMGVTHYRSYKKVKGAKVVAVFSRDPKKLAGDWRSVRGNLPTETGGREDLSGVRRYDDLDAILNDPEVELVDICLPTHLHAEAILKALQAGKHVLVEKPIALTLKDADKMVETAQKVGRFLMVGQVLRFFPEFRLLKEMQESGRYGRLKGLHLKRVISKPTWAADNWFADPKRVAVRLLTCISTTPISSSSYSACPKAFSRRAGLTRSVTRPNTSSRNIALPTVR
jgi:predicted dehydrogenase